MHRLLASGVAILTLVVWGQAAGTAQAQVFDASNFLNGRTATLNYLYNRPTVSPYANLTRSDFASGTALNYQRVVRPGIDARAQAAAQSAQQRSLRAAQMQQQQQAQSGRRRNQGMMGGAGQFANQQQQVPPTGHSTQYGYYSHFYLPQVEQARNGRPF